MGSRLQDTLASMALAKRRADRKMVEDVEEILRDVPRVDLENCLARLIVGTNKIADTSNEILNVNHVADTNGTSDLDDDFDDLDLDDTEDPDDDGIDLAD